MNNYIKEINNENKKIALKVGKQYIIIEMKEIIEYKINIVSCGFVYEDIENNRYILYKGMTFEDSQKIDKIFDSGNYCIKQLKSMKIIDNI